MKLYEIFEILTRASYWVTDKGEVIQSPNPEKIWHNNEAKKYFPNDRDALGEALRHGWIRINAAGHFFDIQLDFGSCSKLAIDHVIELVKDIDIDITYHIEGNSDGVYKKFTSQRSAIRFLNQLKSGNQRLPNT